MSYNLRRIVIIISALFICAVSLAQTVGYSHKPLAAEGCSMKYSVAKQKSFKKDKIGKKLYDFFIKQQSVSDDF